MAVKPGRAVGNPGSTRSPGVGVVAGQLIPVQVGDIEIAVEAFREPGTEPTAGRTGKAAENVLGAFGRAQETIIEVAKSTAEAIDKAGAAARPDRLPVTPSWPRQSHPCSIKSTRLTTARPDRLLIRGLAGVNASR